MQGDALWSGQEEEEEASASAPWSRVCLYWRFRAEHVIRASPPEFLSLSRHARAAAEPVLHLHMKFKRKRKANVYR